MPRKKAAEKPKKPDKKPDKKSATTYKKAKNGRVYKLVGGRPRFVSKKEASEHGF